MSHRLELSQEQIDLILDAIEFKRQHCRKQAKRPLQSWKASEEEKRKQWQYKADELDELASDISTQTT